MPLHPTKARNLLLRQWENRAAIIRVLWSPVDSREPVGTWRQTSAEPERLKGRQAVGWECQHLAQLPCARIIKRILFWEGLDFKFKKKKKRSRVASLRENRLRLWKGLRKFPGNYHGFQKQAGLYLQVARRWRTRPRTPRTFAGTTQFENLALGCLYFLLVRDTSTPSPFL